MTVSFVKDLQILHQQQQTTYSPTVLFAMFQELDLIQKVVGSAPTQDGPYQSAFQQATVAMAILLPDGTLQAVNIYLTQMLGYSSEELTMRHLNDITHFEDQRDGLMQEISSSKNPALTSFQVNRRFIHRSGMIVRAHGTLFRKSDAQKPGSEYFVAQFRVIGNNDV